MVKKASNETAMDTDVTPLYRGTRKELPPSRVDAAILRAARAAVAPRPLARSPFSSAWTVPASVAAVLTLSVALVVFMSHERAVLVSEPLPISTATPTMEMHGGDENQPPAASVPEPARRQETAPVSRQPDPVVADNDKPNPAQPPAPPSSPGERVFETLKPFGRTIPMQRAPTANEAASAVASPRSYANLVSVQAKGKAGAYDFTVKIQGAGNDCSLYVDWWEVLSEDGRLLYRRTLSPRDAQERSVAGSGGPVRIEADTTVWVRAHTHPAGYSALGFKGSPRAGFRKTEMPPAFAAGVASAPPLPSGCS